MASIHPASALGQGLRALASGQTAAAQAFLERALRETPGAPETPAALGQIAAQRRQWAEAEAWFLRSLQLHAIQPRVWLARGQMLEMLQRPADAAEAFVQATLHQPGWAAAHYELARIRRELGQRPVALQAAAQAAHLAPQDANTLQLLAMLQEEDGALPASLATLDAALLLAPERAALHHNRGVVLHRLGRHAEALAAYERAVLQGLDVAEAHYNQGNTLQALGRADDALAAYRRALARSPLHGLSLYDLAKLRWVLGHADFTAELDAAELAAPASAVPPSLLGLLLLRAERGEAAVAAFRRAAALEPGNGAFADGEGQALCLLGRHDESCVAHRLAVSLAPEDVNVLGNAARSFYAAGRAAEGLALAERALALAPQHQHALALVGTGWRLTGDARADWLNDLERCVAVLDVEPPSGWADMASFNTALAEELTRLHTDAEAPIDQTLRHGTQTRGNLFDLDLPLVQALKAQIGRAITAWLATRPAEPGHPFLGRRSAGWHFTDSWSSRLRSSGFHTNHVHGHGWLSSSYYVATPPSALREGSRDGWIKFDEPDLPESVRSSLRPRRMEAPQPGRLVLFPSYLWHGTTPFQDEAYRLTVAFDVLPD
ncbi:tetratricopeptide repeat protein [Roseateles sp. NT4]|uniref:tetratricopeptide repeat protein n=1 Tax=Roseateles sp. NT4 TaxID=3453715 RepID=UPI003EECF2A1